MRLASIIIAALCLVPLVGCTSQNPLAMQSQLQNMQQQQATLMAQNQELTTRASTLDRDNQELETLLAQQQQRARLVEDELVAVREQLSGVTQQLANARTQQQELNQRTEAAMASIRRRAGASISANNSLRDNLPTINVRGVEVRQDGDVIRIELPETMIFSPGSDRLSPNAATVLDTVAIELARSYPKQLIGVEGHTDSDPLQQGPWQSHQHLSVARAMAVYDYLVARTRLGSEQMFVVGHGANHPVVSNATAAGKDRNRRVELVVYPEQVSR